MIYDYFIWSADTIISQPAIIENDDLVRIVEWVNLEFQNGD